MLEDIRKERLKKRKPEQYPARVERTHEISELLADFEKLANEKKTVAAVGRVLGLRGQGGVMFVDIKDSSGKIQAVLKKDNLANFDELQATIDIGDYVEAGGPLFVTQKGEKSIEAKTARLIVKSLLPLPSVWHGLKDVEERFRHRYLDFILNQEIKDKLTIRFKLVQFIRAALQKEDFLEVETPMLQPIPGGASAEPFKTHHNALDTDFYLRIAPELYLKRLLVGGFEKIFEVGRNFRNEGMDRDHNPEFTMLELYWAYHDYKALMKFTEKLLKKVMKQFGAPEAASKKWTTVKFAKIFKEHSGKDYKKVSVDQLDEVFKREVRPKIIDPTFVIDYPEAIMSLAKSHPNEPSLTESFQLIVNGAEIVKGFSELNDPVVQREQMERQEAAFRAGNKESSRLDEDFLEALEYGMPPAAGLGMGIDRLAAWLTKTHAVKEIIAFPTLRPKNLP